MSTSQWRIQGGRGSRGRGGAPRPLYSKIFFIKFYPPPFTEKLDPPLIAISIANISVKKHVSLLLSYFYECTI